MSDRPAAAVAPEFVASRVPRPVHMGVSPPAVALVLLGGLRGERHRSPRVQLGHSAARAEPSERSESRRIEALRVTLVPSSNDNAPA
jgi:hypothetical protein